MQAHSSQQLLSVNSAPFTPAPQNQLANSSSRPGPTTTPATSFPNEDREYSGRFQTAPRGINAQYVDPIPQPLPLFQHQPNTCSYDHQLASVHTYPDFNATPPVSQLQMQPMPSHPAHRSIDANISAPNTINPTYPHLVQSKSTPNNQPQQPQQQAQQQLQTPQDHLEQQSLPPMILITFQTKAPALTLEQIHTLCSPHGFVLRAVIFVRYQFRAIVEFESLPIAYAALLALNGSFIQVTAQGTPLAVSSPLSIHYTPNESPFHPSAYPLSPAVTIDVTFSITPAPLKIVANNNKSRDFLLYPLFPVYHLPELPNNLEMLFNFVKLTQQPPTDPSYLSDHCELLSDNFSRSSTSSSRHPDQQLTPSNHQQQQQQQHHMAPFPFINNSPHEDYTQPNDGHLSTNSLVVDTAGHLPNEHPGLSPALQQHPQLRTSSELSTQSVHSLTPSQQQQFRDGQLIPPTSAQIQHLLYSTAKQTGTILDSITTQATYAYLSMLTLKTWVIPLESPFVNSVLFVENIPDLFNIPHRLAILFGLYGNVIRVRSAYKRIKQYQYTPNQFYPPIELSEIDLSPKHFLPPPSMPYINQSLQFPTPPTIPHISTHFDPDYFNIPDSTALILFQTPDQAKRAQHYLNNLPILGGQRLKVSSSTDPGFFETIQLYPTLLDHPELLTQDDLDMYCDHAQTMAGTLSAPLTNSSLRLSGSRISSAQPPPTISTSATTPTHTSRPSSNHISSARNSGNHLLPQSATAQNTKLNFLLQKQAVTLDLGTKSVFHRFAGFNSRNSKHICEPTPELHVSGLPQFTNPQMLAAFLHIKQPIINNPDMVDHVTSTLYGELYSPRFPPVQILRAKGFGSDNKMSFLTFQSISDAVIALIQFHDFSLAGTELCFQYSRFKLENDALQQQHLLQQYKTQHPSDCHQFTSSYFAASNQYQNFSGTPQPDPARQHGIVPVIHGPPGLVPVIYGPSGVLLNQISTNDPLETGPSSSYNQSSARTSGHSEKLDTEHRLKITFSHFVAPQ